MTNAALANALDRDDDSDDDVRGAPPSSVEGARGRVDGGGDDSDAALADVVARLRVSRTQFAEYCRARAIECDAISSDGLVSAVEACERLKSGERGAFEDVARGLAKTAAALADAKREADATARVIEDELTREGKGEGGVRETATSGRDEDGRGEDGTGDERMEDASYEDANADGAAPSTTDFVERAKYIPMRLTPDERKLLRLLEAALHVSEYTDVVDVLSYRSKTHRITKQLKEICAILCGLVVASDYRAGQRLIVDKEFKDNEAFFQDVFEIGRRHKIMNPEKMRSEYGKLMWLLQDSQSPEVQESGFDLTLVKPLKTVYSFLKSRGGEGLLADALMEQATAEIMHEGLPRHEVQRMIKRKERAREAIASKYQSSSVSKEDILQCLYSIADNNAYLRFNRDPVDQMLRLLDTFFDPDSPEKAYSLGITMGIGGARLSHNHQRQFTYCAQSMMLWREVLNDMFRLWYLAESDLLCEDNRYSLTNTGQGLNRVQHCPRVGKAMYGVLSTCQRKLGTWVGSSVIHLGDRNVPNALVFIDKYSQVSRILNPIVLVIQDLPNLAKDPGLRAYIDAQFGGVEACQKTILADWFRHGFDGSGADSFFDAGSCIDGRLTSAWNWCSKIEKKSYYPIFKLAGFSGFDGGDFRS